jgi:hypothetical protein
MLIFGMDDVVAPRLTRISDALVELATALRELAADTNGSEGNSDAVERLWLRLGIDNQKFLYELAVDFSPDDPPFALSDAAARLDMSATSARARLMNIGRSVRAMGAAAPHLWIVERDTKTRRNTYTWDPQAHGTVLRIVEG